MPTMQNVLVKKDDGTDVTLYPVDDKDGIATWRSNISGISVNGQARLTIQYETMKNGKVRVNEKLTLPIMAVIPAGSVNNAGVQAAPTVLDEESRSTTYYLSPLGSNETRADLFRMGAHLTVGAGSTTGMTLNPQNTTADTFRDVTNGSVLPYGIVNLLFPN